MWIASVVLGVFATIVGLLLISWAWYCRNNRWIIKTLGMRPRDVQLWQAVCKDNRAATKSTPRFAERFLLTAAIRYMPDDVQDNVLSGSIPLVDGLDIGMANAESAGVLLERQGLV